MHRIARARLTVGVLSTAGAAVAVLGHVAWAAVPVCGLLGTALALVVPRRRSDHPVQVGLGVVVVLVVATLYATGHLAAAGVVVVSALTGALALDARPTDDERVTSRSGARGTTGV